MKKIIIGEDGEPKTVSQGGGKGEDIARAVALQYQPDRDDAPRLIAKGKGDLAERIIQIAKENHIPIQEDPMLVSVLYELDLWEVIPPELYEVVAEVLVYVYRVRKGFLEG